MIDLKTEEEIQIMQKGGHILAEVLREVLKNVKPGVSERELDQLAEKLIIEKGAKPGFKKVRNFPNSICVSTNDVVVHGIPSDYKFKEEDVVGVDCGVYYKGFHTDMAQTVRVQSSEFRVQRKEDKIDRFLEVGEKAMNEGIKVAKIGNRVGHISKTIQNIVEKENRYSVVRSLVGHGVGKQLHEEPEVPGFLVGEIKDTPVLKDGMTITVEVIYNMGKPDVVLLEDNWTIKTHDRSISAIFERSIAITKNGPLILTV